MNEYYVYKMYGFSYVLYTGVTNNLKARVLQHKQGLNRWVYETIPCESLVFFETIDDIAGLSKEYESGMERLE